MDVGFNFSPIVLTVYMRNCLVRNDDTSSPPRERLNASQIAVLSMTWATVAILGWIVYWKVS